MGLLLLCSMTDVAWMGMTIARLLISALAVIALLSIQPRAAEACQCVSGVYSTCSLLTSAASVFEATVESIRRAPSPAPIPGLPRAAASMTTFSNDVLFVTLRDVKAWRGAASTTVMTAPDEASCGYTFQIGMRYLIVADTDGGRLVVNRCGLTRPASDAQGLTSYLRLAGVNATRPPISVWGEVTRAARWIDFRREYTAVPDAQVSLEGPTRHSIRTGADGRFEARDLLPGRYTATVTAPATLPLGPIRPWQFELGTTADSACLELDFLAPIQSGISGVVVNDRGQPQAAVFVTLTLPDQRDLSRGAAGGGETTDAQGRYEFKDLPPGRYAIGIGESRSLANATVVSLRFGERLVVKPLVVR